MTTLSKRKDWKVHCFDSHAQRGEDLTKQWPNVTFHQVNVTDYQNLGTAFKNVFTSSGNRLDFVFANAGILEKSNFYADTKSDGLDPPPPPDTICVDVNLKGVIYSSTLAVHYFRQSPHKGKGANLVVTASCASLYAAEFVPVYTASKCK